jgi:hypothetical protein
LHLNLPGFEETLLMNLYRPHVSQALKRLLTVANL